MFPLRAPALSYWLNIKYSPCLLKNRRGQPERENQNWVVANVGITFGIQAKGFKIYTKTQFDTIVCFYDSRVKFDY